MNDVSYIIIYFLIINLIAFLAMGVDKHRAQRQQWRIPEAGLFALVLTGGWIGGIAGMYVFHHKTKKWYFKWGFPAIMIVEIVLILARYIH